MIEKQDLFTRAREAAAKVKELRGEILVRRIELKKALADARRYKNEVMAQLAGVRKPRKAKTGSNAPGPNHPVCWFKGCGKLSVKAVSDLDGTTWDCCADHVVTAGTELVDANE